MHISGIHIVLSQRVWLARTVATVLLFVMPKAMNGDTADSLYSIYLNTTKQLKTPAANKIFTELHHSEFLDTLIHFDSSAHTTANEALTHYWMAEYYFNNGQYDLSTQAGERARYLLGNLRDDHIKSDVLGTLANSYFRQGRYDKALEILLKAYKIDKRLNDDELVSSDLNTLAAIYLAVNQPEPGIRYIEKAVALERKLKRPDRLAIRLGLASELYLDNEQLDKAMAAIEEAYEIDRGDGREEKAAIRLSQMSDIYDAMARYDDAWNAAAKALNTLQKGQNIYSTAVCCNQLGKLSLKRNDLSTAQRYFQKALELGIRSGATKVESDAERGLWQVMRDNNPSVALLHLERYSTLCDSLYHHITSTQMGVMNVTAQNIEQAELNRNTQRNHRLMMLAGSILALMSIVTACGLFYAWRRSKRAYQLQGQANDLRSHFIDNITHALQTPLSTIITAGQQLRDGIKISSDESRQIGEVIYNHGNKMLGLVNQLLDIESTSDKSDDINPVNTAGDIVTFVRLLVNSHLDTAQRQQIALQFTSSVNTLTVMFAPDHIRKIINTLIVNAFKFTPNQGAVTVGLTVPDKNHIVLQVADTGKGIPSGEVSRVFEPFTQEDINYQGIDTAIDLTLVKHHVESMAGAIDVDSALGQGTTFTIRLPFTSVSDPVAVNALRHHTRERTNAQHASGVKPLVFIVENNDDISFFLANYLREGYELRFAAEGQEALRNARELVPNLVITNTVLPVMDGKELMRALRHDSALSHIPIIAMTTIAGETERIDCIRSGADAVLVKPFSSVELMLLASHLIEQRRIVRKQVAQSHTQDPAQEVSKEDKAFINRLVDIIHAQMNKGEIDMDRIADALMISRKVLRERVMDITGLTPVAFALQVRLKRARNMLLSKEDLPLSTIASKCGFQSPSHFSKSFKQLYGLSPTQFRKHGDDLNLIEPHR